ncbi:MAG: fluoride efflux transporter FluC [Gemmatirosa sp.]
MPSPLGATLLVAAGGAAGSVARYLVAQALAGRVASVGQPLGTLTVNVAGSLVLGVVLGVVPDRPDGAARLLVGVGLCGGFTTFSALSAEVVALAGRGAVGRAAAYASLSVAAGVLATLAGLALGRLLGAAR